MSSANVEYVHVEPFIPASKSLPEITPRVLILGVFLAVVLAASSTFVGLKIARTIAGTIPAALISMMVLRRFKNANILENNMVQTIASAGEVVAAGVIFTLPALIIIGYWQSFNYLQTALITIIGGVLGVMFSVPLRQNMVVKENLPYPEGLATAEVLKAGEDTTGSTQALFAGTFLAALISFLQTGLKIAGEQVQFWCKAGGTAFGINLAFSPVLVGAGYIVGIRGLLAFMVGGLLTWGVGIPILVAVKGLPETIDLGAALVGIQKAHFRYVGVGILAVGGIWCVISLMSHIRYAIISSFAAMKMKGGEFAVTPRTERDIPFKYVLWTIAAISIPTFILFFTFIDSTHLGITAPLFWVVVVFSTICALVVGFICASIAAYVVGIVGTTSLPVSGITITAIITFSTVLLGLLGSQIDFMVNADLALKAAAIVIIFAAVVCVAASVSGDNMQDLKAGQLVGATPWKQQVMLAVGAVASALVIPLILQTTFEAYGIGDILPRPGMDPTQALPAVQATLMATIVKGFFGGQLPWTEIYWGVGLAVIAIVVDEYLKKTRSGYRFPPLLFALGFYLPLGYIVAFFVGGLLNYLVSRKVSPEAMHSEASNSGILFASGVIAGEAILGAVLTIPFAYYQSTDVFALNTPWLAAYHTEIGIALYLVLCFAFYKYGTQKQKLIKNV
jgi:putative OPT family oligopeptide transporter